MFRRHVSRRGSARNTWKSISPDDTPGYTPRRNPYNYSVCRSWLILRHAISSYIFVSREPDDGRRSYSKMLSDSFYRSLLGSTAPSSGYFAARCRSGSTTAIILR